MLSASHWRSEHANIVMLRGNSEPRLCIRTIDLFAQREKITPVYGGNRVLLPQEKPACISHLMACLHHGFKQSHRAAAG